MHTRITYLRHLIVSLAQAKDISKTLLIFSHDYYDDDINDLVQTIDFCKVIQVFIKRYMYIYYNIAKKKLGIQYLVDIVQKKKYYWEYK